MEWVLCVCVFLSVCLLLLFYGGGGVSHFIVLDSFIVFDSYIPPGSGLGTGRLMSKHQLLK